MRGPVPRIAGSSWKRVMKRRIPTTAPRMLHWVGVREMPFFFSYSMLMKGCINKTYDILTRQHIKDIFWVWRFLVVWPIM